VQRNVRGVLLAVLIWGLFWGSTPLLAARPVQVVATFSILQDFVEQVGGEAVTVSSLVPLGADPHTWEPSPREAGLVARAELVVANGAGFDDWLLPLVKSAARPGIPLLQLSEGLVPDVDHHDHGHGHGHTADPHLWLSVPNAVAYVERIAAALTELRPELGDFFAGRAQAYIQELWALDERFRAELETIPAESRVIITYHNAFGHLAERYGFAVVEFLVENPEAEPNPRDLGRLVELLGRLDRPVVFTEPQISSGTRYMQALAREAGAAVHVLYSDSLTSEVPTYLQMMAYNLRTLVEAWR